MHDLFITNLQRMDFDPTDKEFRSVVFVAEKDHKNLSFSQIIALEEAEKFEATAVYFRLFSDNRSPVPQIYIYDNSETENELSDAKLAEIHRDLWSNCKIPMFVVISKMDIEIFDSRKPVEIVEGKLKTSPIDTLNVASEAVAEYKKLKKYSKELFDSGVFWENDEAKGHFLESTSAYRDLINNLKFIREEFIKKVGLPEKVAHKLLVFGILIKYLEERGNENGGLFAKNFFCEFNAENFCGVLRQKGKIISLFNKLSQKFNGKIFEWANEEEAEIVEKADLTSLAEFLDADFQMTTRQGTLFGWKLYSFNHLPIELISSVYEEFLNNEKGVVYTPEFLVNTLIDESMPQKDYQKTDFKTIDISCGSGIFLVSVFKKLVQRHRYSEFPETGKLLKLKSDELLGIIKKNIFGIDIKEDARNLTVFSLCLALCDELTPPQIWEELRFNETFDDNFKTANFFEYIDDKNNHGKFDLVIGNPPFISLTKDKNGKYFKEKIENEQIEKYYGTYKEKKSNERKKMYVNEDIVSKDKSGIFPDNQTALMFLEQSTLLLKDNGLVCLIMPSAPLLYNNSFEFRKHFFPKHQVTQILDFTNLDEFLFEADVPTSAIFVYKQEHDEEKSITHVTIRRTKSNEDKIFFEIDKYDFHYVSQQKAINDKHIWKCNLLGGGRLHNLINRLSDVTTIGNYLENKKETDGWNYGVGYEVGSLSKQINPAPYIYLQPTLPTTALTENGVNKNQITIETAQKFHRISDERLFMPPHLLVKTNIGKDKIPTYFSDEYLTFKKVILGIAAPKNDQTQLLELSESFNKNKSIYRFMIAATSNKYLVSRAATLTQDILNLPYPEDQEDLQLSYVEQILCDDVLNSYIQIKSKSSKAKMNKFADESNLIKYGKVFNKLLNSVYGKSGKRFYLNKIYHWGEFYVTEFNYGSETKEIEFEKITEQTEDNLKSIITNELGRNFHLQRVIRINERNKFTFIKPKNLRYWLRSIAIKDADEVFSGLVKAGY